MMSNDHKNDNSMTRDNTQNTEASVESPPPPSSNTNTNKPQLLNFRRASMPINSLHKSAHFSMEDNNNTAAPTTTTTRSSPPLKTPPSRLTIRRSSLNERIPTPIPPFVAPDVEIPKEMLKQQLKQFSYLPSNYMSSDGSQPRPSTPIPSEEAIKHKLKLFQMLNRRNFTLEEEFQAQQHQLRLGATAAVDSSEDDEDQQSHGVMSHTAPELSMMDPKRRHQLMIESMYREHPVVQERPQ